MIISLKTIIKIYNDLERRKWPSIKSKHQITMNISLTVEVPD